MKPAHRDRASEAEYLERERRSEARHEYVNGEIVAMAGASARHNLIVANVIRTLGGALKGRPCLVLASDQRVLVASTRLYTYPDVSVVCGKPKFHPSDPETLENPQLLVEVLSDSTELYDRGAKFAHYQKLDSLTEYLLVSQAERRIEHYHRIESGQWLLTVTQGTATAALPGIGVALPLDEVYANVELLPEPSEAD